MIAQHAASSSRRKGKFPLADTNSSTKYAFVVFKQINHQNEAHVDHVALDVEIAKDYIVKQTRKEFVAMNDPHNLQLLSHARWVNGNTYNWRLEYQTPTETPMDGLWRGGYIIWFYICAVELIEDDDSDEDDVE